MPEILCKYWNGNYAVVMYDDGTKVRICPSDEFRPVTPESMDLKITNYCDRGCIMCHENSTTCGRHGDILNLGFVDTMSPYTEVAIGGGNPLSHPDLVPFLRKLKDLRLIANMTINQYHFMKSKEFVFDLYRNKLIHGLGISLDGKPDEEFIKELRLYPNAVIHVIAGMVEISDLELLKRQGFKLLILGYKRFRRGYDYYDYHMDVVETKIAVLYDRLKEVLTWFDAVSFDNLAIEQLDVKRLMSDDEWEQFYMGDDGTFTMYIDAVKEEFAVSSVSTERFPLEDSVMKMFKKVKEVSHEQRAEKEQV